MNKDKWLPILKKVLKILAISTCGTLLVALGAGILLLNQKPDLSVWHKSHLDEEFTARSLKGRNPVATFGDYLALEDRLFQQLEEKIYDQIEPEEKTVLNRFHRESLSDPGRWPTNWNRSFEWEPKSSAGEPRGSVLLIHGLSDSPYSLRTLGKRLQEEGYHVLGLRVPGHGTAPSGLARTKWQDMAAAVELAVEHLATQGEGKPLHVIGYSNGGALAVHYALTSLEKTDLPRIDRIVLVSPEIGITPAAAFAIWQKRIGRLLGLKKLAWNDVHLEYDPFKYNSFPVNAGDLAHRLTAVNRSKIRKLRSQGKLDDFPPVLAFQSEVDATVSATALVTDLFALLPENEHELIAFGLNREANIETLFQKGHIDQLPALRDDPERSYTLSVITNVEETDRAVLLRSWPPRESEPVSRDLGLSWPDEIYSLSHVALPFPETDPIYGGPAAKLSPGIHLGNISMRGEKGVLRVSSQQMLRLRWNPFYSFLENRTLEHLVPNRP